MGETLWILEGACGGQPFRFELAAGHYTLGREAGLELRLTDLSVSRRHAELVVEPATLTVTDLGSRNGTWVDGRRMETPIVFSRHGTVRFGGVDAKARRDGEETGDAEIGDVPILRRAEGYLSAADSVSASIRLTHQALRQEPSPSLSLGERRLLQALLEAGPLLVEERPLESVFEAVLELVSRVVPARRVLLLLRESEEAEPEVRAARPPLEDEQRLMLSRTLVNEVLEKRESILVTDASLDQRFRDRGSIVAGEVRAALVAPLVESEKVIGLVYLDSSDPSVVYGSDQLRTLTLLANLVAVKIATTRLQEAQRETDRMAAELSTAAKIQASLLPATLPETPGYELCAHQTPCFEVGGDLYDVARLDDGRITVLVGDVTGKGMGAALLMSNLLATLRVVLEDGLPVLSAATRINRQMVRSTDPVHFATLFLGLLDPVSHELEYVNAGHNPPLLLAPDGSIRQLDSTGLPVGMFDGIPYEAGKTELAPGELLCIFSDGIPEAVRDEEFFGEERLEEILRATNGAPLDSVAGRILDGVRDFLAGTRPSDDVTLLLLRRRR